MSTVVLAQEKEHKLRGLQLRCEELSKQCAMLLGFVIPISTAATHVVLLLLIITWFLAGNIQAKVKDIWTNPVARIFFLLFGVFVVGTLYSAAPIADRMSSLNKMGKLLYFPFLLPLMKEEKWRYATIRAFVGAMVLTFGLSLLKVYADFSIYNNENFTIACVFKDHIYTNFMMAFAGFIVGHYSLQVSRFFPRLILTVLWISFTFFVFFMSRGRSGYIIFIALWLLFCLQRFPLKGLIGGLMALALLLGIAFSTSGPFQHRLALALKNIEQYQRGETNTSLGSRLEYFKQSWNLAKERPWFGFGTGSFKQVYEAHATKYHLLPTRNPHNEYLNIMLQTGMVGLATFLGLFMVAFRQSVRLPKPERWFAQGIVVSMVVGCLINSWLMDSTSGYLFVLLTAVCFGALNSNSGFKEKVNVKEDLSNA